MGIKYTIIMLCALVKVCTTKSIPALTQIEEITIPIDDNYIVPFPVDMGIENKIICKTWFVESQDEKLYIKSNGNNHILNVNMEYGFSSLFTIKPQEKLFVALVQNSQKKLTVYAFDIDNFINMMNYDNHQFYFINIPITWKFDNCELYSDIQKKIINKTKNMKKVLLSLNDDNIQTTINAIGCLDNIDCIRKLCKTDKYYSVYNIDNNTCYHLKQIVNSTGTKIAYLINN